MISQTVFTKSTKGANTLPQEVTLLPIEAVITTPATVTWPSDSEWTFIVYQRLIIYSIYFVNRIPQQKREAPENFSIDRVHTKSMYLIRVY